jgi:hypothetical protein
MVQVSMNYNASVYGNAVAPLMDKYNINHEKAVLGQAVFLIAYGEMIFLNIGSEQTAANIKKHSAANYGHPGAKNSEDGKYYN